MANDGCLNKDLFIRIDSSLASKSSFVWNHFGQLHKKPNEILDRNRIYCKLCFDCLAKEQPDEKFSSIRKKVGNYRTTTGTGNMKNHLLAAHQLSESKQMKTTSEHIMSMFSRDFRKFKASQMKQQLGHQLTLMCCRDLLPFSIVENEGIVDFST